MLGGNVSAGERVDDGVSVLIKQYNASSVLQETIGRLHQRSGSNANNDLGYNFLSHPVVGVSGDYFVLSCFNFHTTVNSSTGIDRTNFWIRTLGEAA